ncbi:MAG TPA: Gfo/Idh/MocA family oxidoreductase [Syntrophales bacterium]|nr:Gfo/Idh/MocA family oxidoreductase [Syntrophales bacterium]HOS76501.1 Gfo/Idh/MocA family oxidoreductase [Syntrophales bacterium]HPB69335.1 Gfo/Idh/MocA family oxidoreductase [Syntrophales bacterium]HQP28180.1 Gfo/Idh/MocA family oxidoreductase [Syntrophales bacterium]
MAKIRIGVVGIGHLGTYHLQKFRMMDACVITAVSDSDGEKAAKAAAEYGCAAFEDYRDLIPHVDAVSIAVPTAAHPEVAGAFLAAGIDVFLEKPLAPTLAEAQSLVALAEANGRTFQAGFIERFNPAIVALKALLGVPLFVESHRLHPFFERGTDVDVILDLMIHDLDILAWFVPAPLAHVEAVGVRVLSENVDIANARLTFENGCVANVTASRVTGKTLQKMRFFGLEGYHAVDFAQRELVSLKRVRQADGKIDIVDNRADVIPKDPLEAEIRAFVEAVLRRTPPPVTGRDALAAQEMAGLIGERIQAVEARWA